MKKLLTTLALTLGLLFGGSVMVAAPASAGDLIPCSEVPGPLSEFTGECDPGDDGAIPCSEVPGPLSEFTGVCDPSDGFGGSERCVADQTVTDYRAQLVAQTARADRLQTIADRRAATIKRLRAKIRALR
jgi:hypothetical protein